MFLPSNITLKFGDSGDFVAELQRRLIVVGAHADGGITGFFDGATVNSVAGFQSRSGLRADGIAGPETLRALNGVVSGDTSGSTGSTTEEEEAKQAAQNTLLREELAQPIPQEQPVFGMQPVEEAPAPQPEPVQMQPEPAMQPPPAMTEQQMLQQQLLREAEMHQRHAQPDASEMLAHMLSQHAAETPKPHHPPQPEPRPEPTQATPETVPQQSKGLVGRALDKLDAFRQKWADYFEARLPSDVLREVKNLGHVMLQGGVKEIPIPLGPEQERGFAPPSLPTPDRGVEAPRLNRT